MITENDVVNHVTAYLIGRGFTIIGTATTHQHGSDIVAKSKEGEEIWIEAKGQTSSKEQTPRFGKEFSRNQKEDHLGRALLKCCQYLSARTGVNVGLALPNDEVNSGLIDRIMPALERLKITTFLVGESGDVSVLGERFDS